MLVPELAQFSDVALLLLRVWVQLAAAALIAVMAGALYKKVFVWKTGFWGEEGGGGNLVFLTVGGGGIVLT